MNIVMISRCFSVICYEYEKKRKRKALKQAFALLMVIMMLNFNKDEAPQEF